jgi:hypothetical protein
MRTHIELLSIYLAIDTRKVRQCTPHSMQPEVLRHEMPPRRQSVIIPFAEQRCFERQGFRLQERQESAGEASAIEIKEVAILLVILEFGWSY